MNGKLSRYLLTLLLILPALVRADEIEEAKQRLLQSNFRPTITQLKQAFRTWPATNPFRAMPRNGNGNGHPFPLSALPGIIAQFEKAFPGATWAPLGRDAVTLADALEAFYQALGQQGRVSRLNASGSSFGARVPIYEFLRSAGLDFDRIADIPPFVVFDHTSYGSSSQSTRVMAAGYDAWVARGGNAADLVGKFNLITTNSGTPINASLDRAAFLRTQAEEAAAVRGRFSSILGLVGGQSFMYQAEWHGSFGAIVTMPDGTLSGTPGGASSANVREHILWHLYEIVQLTSSPAFLVDVQNAATALKYEFPLKRQYEVVVPKPPSPEEIMARSLGQLDALLGGLTPIAEGAEQKYLSPNGDAVVRWLQGVAPLLPPNEVTIAFIERLPAMLESRRISSRDFRRLLARALGLSKPDRTFAGRFAELYRRYEPLRRVLKEKREVFTNSQRDDKAAVAAAFAALEGELKCIDIILAEAA